MLAKKTEQKLGEGCGLMPLNHVTGARDFCFLAICQNTYSPGVLFRSVSHHRFGPLHEQYRTRDTSPELLGYVY